MNTKSNHEHIFVSKTGSKENKDFKKKDNLGWYAFLFFVFLLSYSFFSFVFFK